MSENEKPTKAERSEKITIDADQLANIIEVAVSKSAEASAKMLAEALVEAKKPYVDPKQAENEKAMRDSMKHAKERMDEQIKASQATCPHLQGSNPLSNFTSPYGLTAIIQHVLDNGDLIGICTNCLRIFRPEDKDYGEWMRKKSGNVMSRSGERFHLRGRAN